MNRAIACTASWLAALLLQTFSPTAAATPKAAEHENAPVTFGAEKPKPKANATIKKTAAKPAKTVSRTRQTHATSSKHRK